MESSYLENLGGGKFEIKALPLEAQFSPIFGVLPADYNADGYIGILALGNTYSTDVATGRYVAKNHCRNPVWRNCSYGKNFSS